MKLPKKIEVKKLISGRYGQPGRPMSWDAREVGTDEIETVEGEKIKLSSGGQQSSPDKGWVIVLTGGDAATGYAWTLYGLPKGSSSLNANQ